MQPRSTRGSETIAPPRPVLWVAPIAEGVVLEEAVVRFDISHIQG
jgi:hypothetical protein